MLKLNWWVKMANFNLFEKKNILYILIFFLSYLLKYTWINITRWYFDNKWNYLPFDIISKPTELFNLMLFKICSECSHFPRIISIALLLIDLMKQNKKKDNRTICIFLCYNYTTSHVNKLGRPILPSSSLIHCGTHYDMVG